MKKQKIVLFISALAIIVLVSGFVSTIVLAAWPFVDVSPGDWFYTSAKWLYDNGITTGYEDNTYRPNNNVTRAEMAAFLHREAGALIAAGAHVEPKSGGGFEITEWFNNVNGLEPTHNWFAGHGINFHFDMDGRFPMCTVDMDDSIDAVCSAQMGEEQVLIQVWDISSETLLQPIGFWVIVVGNSATISEAYP